MTTAIRGKLLPIRGLKSEIPPIKRKVKSGYNISGDKSKIQGMSVYVVSCKGYSKVGIAMDVSARFSSLRSNNPFPVRLVSATAYPFAFALQIEHKAMVILNDHFHHGEWFKCSGAEATYAVERAADEVLGRRH